MTPEHRRSASAPAGSVLVMGFWKMYNTMHTAMGVPIEDPVLDEVGWVDFAPHTKG